MAEYIEKQTAKEKLCSMCRWEGTSNCDECEHPIDDIPLVAVKPVMRGKWEERIVEDKQHDPYGLFRRRWYCSECGRWQTHGETKFCPDCGADMRGEDDD